MLNKIGKILQSRKAPPEEVEQAYDSVYDNAEHCVICGQVIPEGSHICIICGMEKPKKTEYEILIAAIRTFGDKAQEGVAIEECSELIQAISHKHRGREHNIAEEIADVEIMLEQLKIINDCREETARIHKQKIERLYQCVFNMCI